MSLWGVKLRRGARDGLQKSDDRVVVVRVPIHRISGRDKTFGKILDCRVGHATCAMMITACLMMTVGMTVPVCMTVTIVEHHCWIATASVVALCVLGRRSGQQRRGAGCLAACAARIVVEPVWAISSILMIAAILLHWHSRPVTWRSRGSIWRAEGRSSIGGAPTALDS